MSSDNSSLGIFKKKNNQITPQSEIDITRCESHRIYDISEILGNQTF